VLEETRRYSLEIVQILFLSFFVVFFRFFFVISVLSVFFLSFQFCLSFFLSFFCRFYVISVFACYSFVIVLSFGGHFVIFLSFFDHFGAIFFKIWKQIENCLKNVKNDNEKCNFCNLQSCHFVCHVFVIWWKISHVLSF